MKKTVVLLLLICTLFISARAACPWDDLTGYTNFSDLLIGKNAGDDLIITENVFIDTSMTFPLGKLNITTNGKLVVDPTKNSTINIFADAIMVTGGQLIVGSNECPIPINTTVTFEFSNKNNLTIQFFGTKVLGVFGNTSVLWMYGSFRTPAWTTLEKPAISSATSFILKDPVTWTSGDKIVVSSTDFDHYQYEGNILIKLIFISIILINYY